MKNPDNTTRWRDWLSAYEVAYEGLPEKMSIPCPNCGSDTLNLAFTGLPRDRVGYGSFWCSTCMFGIHLSRCPVPDGVPMDSIYTPPEERMTHIPNYKLVPPDADDDEDDDVVDIQF